MLAVMYVLYGMLLPLLMLGVPIALSLLVLVRSLRRAGPKEEGAHCAACGHRITIVTAGRCPECGGDFLVHGLTTRALATRYRGSTVEALLAWTVLVALAGMLLSWIALIPATLGGPGTITASGSVAWQPADVQGDPPYTVTAAVDAGHSGRASSGAVDFVISGQKDVQIIVDVATGVAIWEQHVYGLDGKVEADELASEVLAVVAPDRPDAEVHDLGDLLLMAIEQPTALDATRATSGRGLTVTSSTVSTTLAPAGGGIGGWLYAGVFVGLLAIWIAGLVLIPLHRRRMLRAG